MWKKKRKGVQKKTFIDTLCESNINTVAEEHFSSENRYPGIVVNDEVPSTSSQAIETIEVVKEVVYQNYLS